jgi:hypothetical protein
MKKYILVLVAITFFVTPQIWSNCTIESYNSRSVPGLPTLSKPIEAIKVRMYEAQERVNEYNKREDPIGRELAFFFQGQYEAYQESIEIICENL